MTKKCGLFVYYDKNAATTINGTEVYPIMACEVRKDDTIIDPLVKHNDPEADIDYNPSARTELVGVMLISGTNPDYTQWYSTILNTCGKVYIDGVPTQRWYVTTGGTPVDALNNTAPKDKTIPSTVYDDSAPLSLYRGNQVTNYNSF